MDRRKEIMIEEHLKNRDIYDGKVLRAMNDIDRKLFVPQDLQDVAYDDRALPIGRGQTISQPYIVAYMAQMLKVKPYERVLEIGSGCGYNAAILSQLAAHVYSVEIIEWLAELASKNIIRAGISNVSIRHGDGYEGWPEKGPYDKIVLTAAAPGIPAPLKEQLKVGGMILGPVSNSYQKLIILNKISDSEFEEHELINVRFVPLTRELNF